MEVGWPVGRGRLRDGRAGGARHPRRSLREPGLLRGDWRFLHGRPGILRCPRLDPRRSAGASENPNYPHLTADVLGLSLDVRQLLRARAASTSPARSTPTSQPQFDALPTESTEVVSVSMGGNDDSIYASARRGAAPGKRTRATRQGPRARPARKSTGRDRRKGAIKEDSQPYTQALAGILLLAPHHESPSSATPSITAHSGPGCPYSAVPFTVADDHWIKRASSVSSTRCCGSAAEADGYTYVEHLCTHSRSPQRLQADRRALDETPGSTPPTASRLHPNALGN